MSERTSAARWRENGDLDPHGSYYDRGRAELMLGDLTDDELANAVFMYGDTNPSITELMNGATMPIVYLTAAKERIRWLSRNLVKQEQQIAELLAKLAEIDSCFEAALIDGWIEAMAEEDISRIKDIYCRRIDYARGVAVAALTGGAA